LTKQDDLYIKEAIMNLPAASCGVSLNSPSLDGRGQGRVKYRTASSSPPPNLPPQGGEVRWAVTP